MNIMALIQQHPLLFADLKHLGLATTTIQRVADTITSQLGGSATFNLSATLHALDRHQFIDCTDVADLAADTGLAPCMAQSVVLVLAPWVDRFRMVQQVG